MSVTPTYRLVRAARPEVSAPVLDAAQRAVVEHSRGPLLVLAGPGTGKTTTLVESVVERVSRGVAVEHLLMLTFSRRAAQEMRERVAARLGVTIREPVARTLHSYAFGVLRMANALRGLPAPRLLSATETDVVLRDLLLHGDPAQWPIELRPALQTRGFADELRDLLMRAVERGLTGPTLVTLGQRRKRPDWVAAGQFLAEYHDVYAMRDPGAYDPAELIQAALNAFADNPALLAAERQRRRRVFVDEYQDTDPAQAELLAVLGAGADELVLVGDPDQSIYAFRGADESAIRDVDERFGGGAVVPTVALTTCRRSGSELLAASRRIAARLPGRAEQRELVPADGVAAGEVKVAVFRSASEEAAYLAGVLRAEYLRGVAWSRMAVLVRSTSRTLGPLRRAMITAGVPIEVRGDDLPLSEQPVVAMLLSVLGVVLDPSSLTEEVAESLLCGPIGGGDALYLRRLRRTLRLAHPDEQGRLVPAVTDPVAAQGLPDRVRRPVAGLARVLSSGRAAVEAFGDAEELLWAIWDASRLASRWDAASATGGVTGAAADRDLDAALELFAAAADFTDRLPHLGPAGFRAHVAAQQIPGSGLRTDGRAADAVSILTAHASKGLEWDVVCVANVQEGSWPDLRRRGSLLGVQELTDAVTGIDLPLDGSIAQQLAQERRLFYVAVTRAKRRLIVTAVAGEEEQPSRLLDELAPTDGTRATEPPMRGVHLPGLVAELRAAVCDDTADDETRRSAAAQLARVAAAGVLGAHPDSWWGLAALSTVAGAADPSRPVSISPSRIDSFFQCELRTLMQDLGVRDGDAVAANLGTVIHRLAETSIEGETLEQFEARLDEVWAAIDFGASWFADNERARAGVMLHRLATWLRDSRTELTEVGRELPFRVEIGDAVISGRVDRLERDREGRLVVIDLKTGKSKATDLEAHPQLGSYQLAIEHGAFADAGSEPGGAQLVQLGAPGDIMQRQRPLAESEDPLWPRRAVDEVAARMRGYEFSATVNQHCHVCDVRTACPLQPQGRQVPS